LKNEINSGSKAGKEIQKAIDESGYPIANRGLESQTSLDSADRLLKKANLNNKKSILETILLMFGLI
jgi:hypothetical protein